MEAFLFTDIESSTRLWEEHPAEMALALEKHDAILGQVITDAGGIILKTTGDGVIAVFEMIDDSVRASVAAQKALTSHDWGSASPVRVRMGLHAGLTQSREGDHFGPVMNRTARIMGAAHGGQILVSAVIAEQVGAMDDIGLIDLGNQRLRDLTAPERLHQLTHPDIPAEFPAPLTLDAHPHNLPLQTTEFVGRSAELAAIKLMLETPATRLLTISGPGGAGKTRLALQVAAEFLDRFRDGVFFIDLARERDPNAAYEAIVRGLELPTSDSGGHALQILKTRLRDKEMLLLLDNFEQVTAAGSGVVEIIQSAPEVKVLVTSRETLKVRAEQVFPVPSLGLPDPRTNVSTIGEAEAVQLFVDRARAVRPQFTLDADNAEIIAQICLRLDGLPLAIELAAARLNLFSPADLLARIQDRLDVLGAGGRDLPDRHRTLWGAIGWSYELLDEDECRLFEMMSVFSSAQLEAIEAVASETIGSNTVLDTLASLVDKSLIRSEEIEGSRRFSMLLMIKEYADSRLDAEPEFSQTVHRAHADYYSGNAMRLRDRLLSQERVSALADLSLEIGNLRAAWRYWVDTGDLERLFGLVEALWTLHEAKGWYHAAIELATDALDALGNADAPRELDTAELTLRTGLARALMAVHGYSVEVEEAYRRVLELYEAAGSEADRYPVLRSLATYYQNTNRWDKAAELGGEILEIAEMLDDDTIRVEGMFVYGTGLLFSGMDPASGMTKMDEAIALFDPKKHGVGRFRLGPSTGVSARIATGLTLWLNGMLDQGVHRVRESLQVARSLNHPYSVAYALYHNGFLALRRQRFEECLEWAEELSAISDENGYLLWRTLATVLGGAARTHLGETEDGLTMTESAIEIYQGLTTPPVFWPLLLALRAQVNLRAGQPRRALELIDEAVAIGSPQEEVFPDLRMVRGDILLAQPQLMPEQAEESYLSAAKGARTIGARLIELETQTRLVRLRRELGVSPDGNDDLAATYGTFTEGHDEHPLVEARALLGDAAGHKV